MIYVLFPVTLWLLVFLIILIENLKHLGFMANISLLTCHSCPVTLEISLFKHQALQSFLTYHSLLVTFDKSLLTIHYWPFTFKLYPFDLSLSLLTCHFWPVTPDLSLLTYHLRPGTLYLSILTCHTWPFYQSIAIWNFLFSILLTLASPRGAIAHKKEPFRIWKLCLTNTTVHFSTM